MNRHWYEQLWPREGWGVFLLALALVVILGAAVADAGWVSGLSVMPTVSLVAFVISFLIARSRLPIFLAHVFSLTIGLAWTFRVTAELLPLTYSWPERWAWMWYRIYLFGGKLVSGGISDDNLIFILQMSLLVWIITYLVVWFVFRARRVWDAVIVSGLLLMGGLYYAPRDLTGYLVFFLLVALLLVIRYNLFLQEQVWQRARVQFNAGEITFDFWRAGLALSLLVLALAWLAPAIPLDARSRALDALRAPWYDLEDQWSRLFTSVRYRAAPGADFSGQSLNLGGPRELSDTPVLEIAPSHQLFYWREVALDRYSGRSWVNTDETGVRFGAEYPPVAMVSYQARQPVSHTVTTLIPNTSVLATAGQPVWTSRPSRARVSYVEEMMIEGISYVRSRLPFREGDTYTVSGLQSVATIKQLRLSGDAYPDWITARYLQLPPETPDRVRELAQTIAATHTNDYDRAAAVESYLRRTITYNEKIDAPPPDRDAVDYVLFDLRQGYCDYYASSMVVLLRTLGIPARMAAGYAQGEYNYDRGAFVVRQKDAHAWPEVFFPGYGWVEFEPTAGRPTIERLHNTDPTQTLPRSPPPAAEQALNPGAHDRNLDRLEGDDPADAARNDHWLIGALVGFGGLALAMAAGAAVVWLKLRRAEAGLGPVEVVHLRMRRLAEWAGAAALAWQTPYEHAAAVAAVVPAGRASAWQMAELVTLARYAGNPSGIETCRNDLVTAWRALRPLLVRAALRRRLAMVLGRSPAASLRSATGQGRSQ